MAHTTIEAPDAPIFNPLAPEVIADPYAFYDQFRAHDPVYKTPLGFWLVTQHDHVSVVLRDRQFGRDFENETTLLNGPQAMEEPLQVAMRRMMLFLEPPDHPRVRKLVTKAFSAKRIEEMRPRIRSIAERLIDKARRDGGMDVVSDFALPLPITVICDMLGIPDEDRGDFLNRFRITSRVIDIIPLTPTEKEEVTAQLAYLQTYFRKLFDMRRSNPGDDLTTHLVQAEEAGDKLSEDELLANILLLFVAGHETTSNAIGNSLHALYRNPEQLHVLKERPQLIRDAVHELLRYDSPVQLTSRSALEDVVLGNKQLCKGDFIVAALGAANRDPATYPNANRLDVSRKNVRPLSFGGGIHHCLGAQLANIELELALTTLFEKIPHLQLTDVEHPRWRPSCVWRGLETLPAIC